MTTRRALSWASFVLIIIAPIILWLARFEVYDWWKLKNYTPPSEVVQLAQETTMTDKARRLFYVHKPQIIDDKN